MNSWYDKLKPNKWPGEFLADSASALALGSRLLAFLAKVTPRRGVGSSRCRGESEHVKVPAPSGSGIASVETPVDHKAP